MSNVPSYFKFLMSKHKSSAILSIIGIIACIYVTPILLEASYYTPLIIVILGFIAIYGFTIGMILNPWTIYRKLKKTNYWGPNSPYNK